MTTALDPNYNWKAAASQESVDYEAVNKSFMDQAYGMVANKAPKLFADPFRLGFEIVYRNEKATKMIGDFLFRVNGDILQVPVFFINGETKPADMLYRGGVKRMVPFTARWVDFLIKGADGDAGELVDRSRMRQRDLHGERLSVPRYTKYATENFTRLQDDGFLDEEPLHEEQGEVLKWATEEFGPVVMEKLADWLENAPRALAYVAENYDLASYTTKAAAKEEEQPVPALRLITDLAHSKAASTTDWITRDGFAVVDDRHEFAVNPVVQEEPCADYTEVKDAGFARFKLSDGKDILGVVYRLYDLPDEYTNRSTRTPRHSRMLVFEDGQSLRLTDNDVAFGQELACMPPALNGLKISEVAEGGTYLVIKDGGLSAWGPFKVESKTTPKEGATLLGITNIWGSALDKMQFVPGKNRSYPDQGLLTDDARFIKLQVTKPEPSNKDCCVPSGCNEKLKSEYKLMSSAQIDKWMRTGFGNDVEVIEVSTVKNAFDNYDVTIRPYRSDVRMRICENTSKVQAIVKLATDLGMHADDANALLSTAKLREPSKVLVVDALQHKKAFVTRVESLRDIPNSVDPQTRLRVEHPDTQVLATYTPSRYDQKARYGDKMDLARPANDEKPDDLKHKLPMEMIQTASPEELAQHAQSLGLSSIFDHGAVASMSKTVFDVSEQIRQYIPQLEAAVDRYFRILFLMRYRTADFEENFGKEEVMEMEATLASLAKETGENLLDLIERFRPDIGANAS